MPNGRRQEEATEEASLLAIRHPGRRKHAAQALRRESLLIQFSASPQGRGQGEGALCPPGRAEAALGTEGATSGSPRGHEPSCCQPPPLSPCRRELLKEVPEGQTPNVELGSVRKQKKKLTPPADASTATPGAAPLDLRLRIVLPSVPPPRHIKATMMKPR